MSKIVQLTVNGLAPLIASAVACRIVSKAKTNRAAALLLNMGIGSIDAFTSSFGANSRFADEG